MGICYKKVGVQFFQPAYFKSFKGTFLFKFTKKNFIYRYFY